jgi:hypothetical protein
MEGMPVRFYRYRYLDYWEAELPVSWFVAESAPMVAFSQRKHGGTVFSVFTIKKNHWDSILKDMSGGLFKPMLNWEKAAEKARLLGDGSRVPEADREYENPVDGFLYRHRIWSFRAGDLLIYVEQSAKSNEIDADQLAVVDRFAATLSLTTRAE